MALSDKEKLEFLWDKWKYHDQIAHRAHAVSYTIALAIVAFIGLGLRIESSVFWKQGIFIVCVLLTGIFAHQYYKRASLLIERSRNVRDNYNPELVELLAKNSVLSTEYAYGYTQDSIYRMNHCSKRPWYASRVENSKAKGLETMSSINDALGRGILLLCIISALVSAVSFLMHPASPSDSAHCDCCGQLCASSPKNAD